MKIIAAITAIEVLVLTLWLVLLRYHRSARLKTQGILIESALVSAGNSSANHIVSSRGAWAVINKWQVAPAADDRKQTNGTVAPGSGSISAQRSSARRSHQANYKAWSKERHD
jgi:hypothetical protein